MARDCGIAVRHRSATPSCDAGKANLDGTFPSGMAEATKAKTTRAIDPPQGAVTIADAAPGLVGVQLA